MDLVDNPFGGQLGRIRFAGPWRDGGSGRSAPEGVKPGMVDSGMVQEEDDIEDVAAGTDAAADLSRWAVSGLPRTPKTSEVVARQLLNYIFDSGFKEGSVLPPEREMLKIFGVGRATLREALRLLETRYVITIKPGPKGGPVVQRPRPENLREGLSLILQFEEASLRDVLLAREALEPMTARLAASRIRNDRIAILQDTIDRIKVDPDDYDLFLQQNVIFHNVIAESSGAVVLRVFVDTLKVIADGAVAGVHYTPARHLAVAEAHARILDALSRHDEDAAENEMRKHLEEAGAYWQKKYPELLARPVRWHH